MHFNLMKFSPKPYYFRLLYPSIILVSLFHKKKQQPIWVTCLQANKYIIEQHYGCFPWLYVHMFGKHTTKMCFLRIITLA
jgi:hypothetical protein